MVRTHEQVERGLVGPGRLGQRSRTGDEHEPSPRLVVVPHIGGDHIEAVHLGGHGGSDRGVIVTLSHPLSGSRVRRLGHDVDPAEVRGDPLTALRRGVQPTGTPHETFTMRPEQADAVKRTHNYFHSIWKEDIHAVPRFLWNAKMRFGKTFASYQLAKRLRAKRVLVVTFKP